MSAIRAASARDLEALVELETVFDPADRMSRRAWRRAIAGPASVLVVARDEGLAAAAVMLYRRGARVARLYSLAVAPAARGQGHARTLIEAAAKDAAAHGCDRVRLEVRAGNTTAISLYENAGFAVIGETSSYYPDGENALRLEKRVCFTIVDLT